MKRIVSAALLAVALTLVLAAPAFAAGPEIEGLTSPTHPDQWAWYYGNDPVFTWTAAPGPVGSGGVPNCGDVAIAGGYAYVAAWYDGLWVLDVSDPTMPYVVGSCAVPGFAGNVDVVGGYAYIASSWGGLQIVDVSEPTAPVVVGSCSLPGEARDVAVVGSYAYIGDGDGGLQVVDVSDRAGPVLAGSCWLPGFAHGIAVSGSHAYVGAYWGGLQVVDVSVPSMPTLIASCGLPYEAIGVALSGGLALVGSGYGGLQVVDVSDPIAPAAVGWCSLPDYAMNVAVIADRAYVADGAGDLQVVDFSDATAPHIAFHYAVPGNVYGVALATGKAFVGTDSGAMQVLDIDPATDFAYSYELDQAPDTEPDVTAEGTGTTASFSDVADGLWWFHVRAVDAEGNWGPTAHRQVMIDCTGPITAALSYKTDKRGAIWLRYSATDDHFGWANVTIDIRNAAGRLLFTMDLGTRETNAALSTVVDRQLAKGRYRFLVHAVDPLGNQESQTGAAWFVVR